MRRSLVVAHWERLDRVNKAISTVPKVVGGVIRSTLLPFKSSIACGVVCEPRLLWKLFSLSCEKNSEKAEVQSGVQGFIAVEDGDLYSVEILSF